MLTASEIKHRLKDSNIRKVAEASGVSYITLWRLMNKETENSRDVFLEKVSEYLEFRREQ